MGQSAGKKWSGRTRFGLVLLLFLSMTSFAPHDPTLFNLLSSSEGIRNWMGIGGALVGGTLVELLGGSALWIPVLIFLRLITRRPQLTTKTYALLVFLVPLFSASLHGLFPNEPGLGLKYSGLIGMAGARWVEVSTGFWPGTGVLVWGLGYALVWVLAPAWSSALWTDVRLVVRFLARTVLHRSAKIVIQIQTLASGLMTELRFLGRNGISAWWQRTRAGMTKLWVGAAGSGGLRTRIGRRRSGKDRWKPQVLKGDWTAAEARAGGVRNDGFDTWFSGVQEWTEPQKEGSEEEGER